MSFLCPKICSKNHREFCFFKSNNNTASKSKEKESVEDEEIIEEEDQETKINKESSKPQKQAFNIFVRNIEETVTDEDLKKHFSTVTRIILLHAHTSCTTDFQLFFMKIKHKMKLLKFVKFSVRSGTKTRIATPFERKLKRKILLRFFFPVYYIG